MSDNRRTLLKRSALGAAAIVLPIGCLRKGALTDVRVAICGLHGRGKYHLDDMLKMEGVRVVAICDVDQRELRKHEPAVRAAQPAARSYIDYRKLCEDPEVDGIIIATPNHTHALIGLTAIAAGKHVYIEKPVSHNLREGRLLVEAAAKRPKQVITHGMQRRSDLGWEEIWAWLAEGHLGKVTLSRGLNYKLRESIGKADKARHIPTALDYNLWCGPRPVEPVMREQLHYDWHWQWPYGNGDIGNQGPHQLDVARWALGQMGHPISLMSLGSRWGYDDNGDTPNNQLAFFRYGQGAPLLFDNRGLPAKNLDWKLEPAYKGIRIGNIIHCEGGYVAEAKAFDSGGQMVKKFSLDDGARHQQQWIDAIRAGRLLSPNQDIVQGHYSAALAHLANTSWRLGKQLPPDQIKERLQGDAEALATWDDFQANLLANGLDAGQQMATVGPWLSFDPKSERFTGEFAAEANALQEEVYRPEFALPTVS
jgi:predicted dehydrogenase